MKDISICGWLGLGTGNYLIFELVTQKLPVVVAHIPLRSPRFFSWWKVDPLHSISMLSVIGWSIADRS